MINLAQARELVPRAVETQGREFVYRPGSSGYTCRYEPYPVGQTDQDAIRLPEGTPCTITGCLIGVALSLAGETRHIGFRGSVWNLVSTYRDMMTRAAAGYFAVAQHAQDSGAPWGEAHDRAESWVTTYDSADYPDDIS